MSRYRVSAVSGHSCDDAVVGAIAVRGIGRNRRGFLVLGAGEDREDGGEGIHV